MTFEYPKGATPLEPDDLNGLKHGHVTTRGELDQLEQANIVEGLRWLERVKNPDILSETFIRDLHRNMFGEVWEWAGQFRTRETNIGCPPYEIPVLLRQLLDDVKYWIENESYPKVEIALRFHFRLVKIHLFPNGNGRHARILADELLRKILGRNPIDWSKGYDLQVMNPRRNEYLEAIYAAEKGDFRPLLRFAGVE